MLTGVAVLAHGDASSPLAGFVGGLRRVSVPGGLPEAAAPLGGAQVPGSLPGRLALAGRRR